MAEKETDFRSIIFLVFGVLLLLSLVVFIYIVSGERDLVPTNAEVTEVYKDSEGASKTKIKIVYEVGAGYYECTFDYKGNVKEGDSIPIFYHEKNPKLAQQYKIPKIVFIFPVVGLILCVIALFEIFKKNQNATEVEGDLLNTSVIGVVGNTQQLRIVSEGTPAQEYVKSHEEKIEAGVKSIKKEPKSSLIKFVKTKQEEKAVVNSGVVATIAPTQGVAQTIEAAPVVQTQVVQQAAPVVQTVAVQAEVPAPAPAPVQAPAPAPVAPAPAASVVAEVKEEVKVAQAAPVEAEVAKPQEEVKVTEPVKVETKEETTTKVEVPAPKKEEVSASELPVEKEVKEEKEEVQEKPKAVVETKKAEEQPENEIEIPKEKNEDASEKVEMPARKDEVDDNKEEKETKGSGGVTAAIVKKIQNTMKDDTTEKAKLDEEEIKQVIKDVLKEVIKEVKEEKIDKDAKEPKEEKVASTSKSTDEPKRVLPNYYYISGTSLIYEEPGKDAKEISLKNIKKVVRTINSDGNVVKLVVTTDELKCILTNMKNIDLEQVANLLYSKMRNIDESFKEETEFKEY